MAIQQAKSFAEVAFLEAVARRTKATLVIKPVTQSAPRRLNSRFLAANGNMLVMATPSSEKGKIFLPHRWHIGMSFSLGDFALQALTTVVGHCQFELHPGRRIDAIVVDRPKKITQFNRRSQPRHEISPSLHVLASLWAVEALLAGNGEIYHMGRLHDWSDEGLGIRLNTAIPVKAHSEMIIRLHESSHSEYRIYRGLLVHCCQHPPDGWVAGFGNVSELHPGQAVKIMESIAAQ